MPSSRLLLLQQLQMALRETFEVMQQFKAVSTQGGASTAAASSASESMRIVAKLLASVVEKMVAARSVRCAENVSGEVSGQICTLEFSCDAELGLVRESVSALLKAFGDLHEYELEAKYLTFAVGLETCDKSSNVYVMCSGHLYQRLIILSRHHLSRPEKATEWYRAAVTKRDQAPWPSEWHLGLDFRKGLRSQPFWDGDDAPPFAGLLEENFKNIRNEFDAFRRATESDGVWSQNDYFLQVPGSGSWTEVNLFQANTWDPRLCAAMPTVCGLLQQVDAVAGQPPPSLAKGDTLQITNQVAIFRLEPGTHLVPHAGPSNYRLYCHLGLVVPDGPYLRVGPGPPRQWAEGRTMCFDDSFVHEAWNNGTEPRYVLMAAWWHPDL